MTFLAVAFSLVLVGSFFYGEFTKLSLKDTIHKKTVSEVNLKSELVETKTEASTQAERLKQLEEDVKAQSEENKKLAQKLAEEERRMTTLLAKRSELEEKVKVLEEKKKTSDVRLRAEALIFENDNLAVKLRGARAAVMEARSSGLISSDVAEGLLSSINEAESIVDEARSGRIAVEKMLSSENLQDLEGFAGEGWVQELVKKDKEQTESLVKRYQENLKERAKADFKERLTTLEERLVNLSESKKLIEEKWTEAMTAMLRMDETAGKIEGELRKGPGKGSGYETLAFATPEGVSKLLGEMETLRKAREDVLGVMDKIKETIEDNIETETKMMLSETSQVSHALSDLFLDAKAPEFERVGLRTLEGASPEERLTLLSKHLEDLNVALDGRLIESSPAGAPPTEKRDFDIYVVKEGDTLWTIAAQKNIYGNPYMWPVLYKDNALKVQNPHIIHPQLKIVIRKDISNEEISSTLKETTGGQAPVVDRNNLPDWLREICAPLTTTTQRQ